MANAAVDTGHGASATFSSTSLSFNWTSIDLGEETITDVKTTKLATTGYHEYMPGDLKEGGEVSINFQWDSEAAQVALGTVETLTATLPIPAGGSTAATLAGTGYIKRIKRTSLETDTLQTGELTFMFDGGTGPAYTAGT